MTVRSSPVQEEHEQIILKGVFSSSVILVQKELSALMLSLPWHLWFFLVGPSISFLLVLFSQRVVHGHHPCMLFLL